MAKSIVFLVHGIGIQGGNWSGGEHGPIQELVKAANAYSGFDENSPITDCIEFVQVRYDDIFDEILGQWKDLALGLEGIPEASPDAMEQIAATLSDHSDPDDNAFASHGMDIIFYNRFALIRRLVQLTVISKIMQTVVEKGRDRKYCVIAHSHGTTVVHDSIHRMASTEWLNKSVALLKPIMARMKVLDIEESEIDRIAKLYAGNPFGPSAWAFDDIFLIANTSKILHKDTPPPDRSFVCPPGVLKGKRMCHRFYNIYHLLDPVCWINSFKVEEVWKTASNLRVAQDIKTDHLYDLNVHKLSHYLMHPSVHRHIFSSLASQRFTRKDNEYAEFRVSDDGDFAQFGPKFSDEDLHETIMEKLSYVSTNDSSLATASGVLERLIAFKSVIDELAEL